MADKVENKIEIYKKLHEIQKDVKYIKKGGKNTSQNYAFLSELQITELFKDLLEKHKVFFTYSSSIKEVRPSPKGTQLITDVLVRYEFIDLDSGEVHSGFASGQGSDANDKGVYKAITGAIKYIFMKTFLIATGDDPENDSGGKKKRASKKITSGGVQASMDSGIPPFGEGSEEED